MSKLYLANAFSLQMVAAQLKEAGASSCVRFTTLTKEQASQLLSERPFVSAIGHADTAAVVSDDLHVKAECNRCFVSLESGDAVLVAQVVGGRLPEGCITLPEGMELGYYLVEQI